MSRKLPKAGKHEFEGLARQLPFNRRAGQVPGDIYWAGKEVVVSVTGSICLEQMSAFRTYPFVRLHAAIYDDGVLAKRTHVSRKVNLEFVIEIETEHLV